MMLTSFYFTENALFVSNTRAQCHAMPRYDMPCHASSHTYSLGCCLSKAKWQWFIWGRIIQLSRRTCNDAKDPFHYDTIKYECVVLLLYHIYICDYRTKKYEYHRHRLLKRIREFRVTMSSRLTHCLDFRLVVKQWKFSKFVNFKSCKWFFNYHVLSMKGSTDANNGMDIPLDSILHCKL